MNYQNAQNVNARNDAFTISAPKPLSWRLHRACPSCGEQGPLRHRLLQLIFKRPDRHFAIGFCEGGKEPTQEVSIHTPVGLQKVEGRYACAGISTPHLHLTCRNCNFHLLVETKEKSQ